MNLRPYQQQLITDIRLQYQLGHRQVLAVLPTGGGKTVIFSHIAQSAARKGNRVCILVHRQELLDQASRSLTAMGVPHGRIAAGRGMDLSHAVQVASVQTLARRLHLLPREFFQLLVVDEAHHTTAGTWSKVVAHFAAARLLGVTATPVRGDGRGLGEHYQAMVQGPSAAWLTEQGFLALATVLAPPGFDASGLRRRMGDFDAKAAEQRVASIVGDCYSHYCQHLSGQTAIAFCCSVAHAEAVADLFKRQGIAAASIDGSMDTGTRRQLLDDLGTGRLKVLTSCALIGEGVDVPSVGGCILLRPTQSEALHLQMIGRCLRPQPGKRAVILDHVGNTLRLGHHLEEREWTLEGITKRDREKAPSVKVCPKCFAAMASAAQECGECGHEFRAEVRELEVVEGELVELPECREIKGRVFCVGDRVLWHRPVTMWKMEETKERIVAGFDRHFILLCLDWQFEYKKSVGHYDLSVSKAYPADLTFIDKPNEPAGKPDPRREQSSAQSLQDLIALGQQRGYKNPAGWAKYVLYGRSLKGR